MVSVASSAPKRQPAFNVARRNGCAPRVLSSWSTARPSAQTRVARAIDFPKSGAWAGHPRGYGPSKLRFSELRGAPFGAEAFTQAKREEDEHLH